MEKYPFGLLKLKDDYGHYEPVLSRETLEYHHDKHLKTYVDNLNKALENVVQYHDIGLQQVLINVEGKEDATSIAIKNNGGGVYNHNFYFEQIRNVNEKANPMYEVIEKYFGSYEKFKQDFKNVAISQFGSGWAWLVSDKNGVLSIKKTQNQDTPIVNGYIPLLNIDVWEHAYYIDYRNDRALYIDEFFKIIDWDKVKERYDKV